MSILSKLFGGGGQKNPADAAMPYLNQIPGVAHQGYDPYVTEGRNASGKVNSEYENLMNDPTGFINKLMEAYKPSEGYNYQKNLLTKELANTSAAGGIAGTEYDQMRQGEGVQGLLSKDMQQFLQNALGVYGAGLSGEQGVADKGFNATKELTDVLGGNLNQQANLGFKGQSQKNSNQSAFFQAIAKALGTAGGAFLGGPAGAVVGGGLGSSMFGGG